MLVKISTTFMLIDIGLEDMSGISDDMEIKLTLQKEFMGLTCFFTGISCWTNQSVDILARRGASILEVFEGALVPLELCIVLFVVRNVFLLCGRSGYFGFIFFVVVISLQV